MDQLISKSNNLLKNILTPSNVLSLAIRFPYNVSTITQNITVSREYQLFKLVNLGLIGSSSWYNISQAIGNNRFSFGQVEQNFFNDLIFTRAYLVKNKVPAAQTPILFTQFNQYNYTVWPSNTRDFQEGELNNSGVFIPSTTGTVYTSSPYAIPVYGNIIVTPVAGYDIKITVFNLFTTTATTFNSALSETVYSNAQRTIATIIPAYVSAGNIQFGSFIINIKRTNGGIINPNDLDNLNLCTIDSGATLNRTVITQTKVAPGTYNASTGQALTFSYNFTYDYIISVLFYNPITNAQISTFVFTSNTTTNNITFTCTGALEGSYFYFNITTIGGRAFNSGDLTNMQYILKDLALGTTIFPDVVIPDGFYSGVYNSPALTNPVNFGWKYIVDQLTLSNPNLIFTFNNNLTVKIQNTSADNIVLGFSGFGTNSSGRFLGFYDVGSINIPPTTTITSPNQIDLDSDGRFDKIAINFPYLNSVGFAQESNSIIYLQKGSSYLQNISNFLPFYAKVINTNRIDALTFNIVDGKNQAITLFDSLLFTAEIQVFQNPDF